jgi:benzoate membrane transport protein
MPSRSFASDFSVQAAVQGLIAAMVGYASSVAVVIAGLKGVGASKVEIASGLFFLGLGMGLAAIGLSLRERMPISIAWTTPGLALLATTGTVTGGFPAAVGAFIVAGLLIVLTGLFPQMLGLVRAIPKPIASAMLAGILLKLCLAPFVALKSMPLAVTAIIVTWIIVGRFARLYAVPAAVLVTLAFIFQGGTMTIDQSLPFWPAPVLVMPVFTLEAFLNITLPLFIVTMASQNITGLAVMATYDFHPSPRQGLVSTGFISAITAPLGAPSVNFAAITAALCASPDAHPDPSRRYVAAVIGGVGYILLAALAAIVAGVVTRSSPVLIEAVAGLALITAFGASLMGAVQAESSRMPALLTFLVTASGLTIFGIGAAFWGLVIGWSVHAFMDFDRASAKP